MRNIPEPHTHIGFRVCDINASKVKEGNQWLVAALGD
jgi:acetolactate synthase regulatory subunit